MLLKKRFDFDFNDSFCSEFEWPSEMKFYDRTNEEKYRSRNSKPNRTKLQEQFYKKLSQTNKNPSEIASVLIGNQNYQKGKQILKEICEKYNFNYALLSLIYKKIELYASSENLCFQKKGKFALTLYFCYRIPQTTCCEITGASLGSLGALYRKLVKDPFFAQIDLKEREQPINRVLRYDESNHFWGRYEGRLNTNLQLRGK